MLTLPIKKQWFDMIRSGEKTEEYRKMSIYWARRFEKLWGKDWLQVADLGIPYDTAFPGVSGIHTVRFRNGYRSDSPAITAECSLTIGTGNEEWGAEPGEKYFILTIYAWRDEHYGNQ